MKVILIDDEQLALDVLEILIKKVEGIEIGGKYMDPQLAFQELENGGNTLSQFPDKLITSFGKLLHFTDNISSMNKF